MTPRAEIYDPKHHGTIPPVTTQHRPMWSVVIPTYHCADYLQETLRSVLDQDPGEDQMEVIVVDDCSVDDSPKKVVDSVMGTRARFIRQSQNVGKARNYETGIAASTGHYIHQLHGDDSVADNFYSTMQRCILNYPDAAAVFCESRYIDQESNEVGKTGRELSQSGMLEDWLATLACRQRIQTPSIVVRRDVYETLGAFDRRLTSFEDWEMWVRIATSYRFAFNGEAYANYRVYGGNTSSQSIISGRRAATLQTTLAIMDSYLPTEILATVMPRRSKEMAEYLIQCLPTAVDGHSMRGWARLCFHALRHQFSPRVIARMVHFTLFYRRYV